MSEIFFPVQRGKVGGIPNWFDFFPPPLRAPLKIAPKSPILTAHSAINESIHDGTSFPAWLKPRHFGQLALDRSI